MKLKSVILMASAAILLTACTPNPNIDDTARNERIAQKQAVEGCTLLESHQAYRDCLIATAQKNSPKTFVAAENSNGQAVIVIKSNTPCDSTCVTPQKTVIETEVVKTVTVTKPKPVVTETVTEVVKTPTVTEEVQVQEVVAPVPEKEKTWWEQYQANKKPEVAAPVKCPCPDPNDPCPQCIEK